MIEHVHEHMLHLCMAFFYCQINKSNWSSLTKVNELQKALVNKFKKGPKVKALCIPAFYRFCLEKFYHFPLLEILKKKLNIVWKVFSLDYLTDLADYSDLWTEQWSFFPQSIIKQLLLIIETCVASCITHYQKFVLSFHIHMLDRWICF